MRRMLTLIGLVGAVLFAALPATATTGIEFFKTDVTQALPLQGEVTVVGDGLSYLSGQATSPDRGFTLTIAGPVVCSAHSTHYRFASCSIKDAPVGIYEITVVPDHKALTSARVVVMGELLIVP